MKSLTVHEITQRLRPWRGHVDTPGVAIPPAAPGKSSSDRDSRSTRPGATSGGLRHLFKGGEETSFEEAGLPGGVDIELERKRAYAIDAIHTYIWAMCEYDHRRADLILSRVLTTLDNQLDPCGRADHRPR